MMTPGQGNSNQIKRQAFVNKERILHKGRPAASQAIQASIASIGSDG
jgi:hypothetical protein